MAARVSGRAARQFILGQRMGRAPLGMFCGGRPDKRRAARTESAAKKTQHKHDAFGPTLSDAPVAAQLIEEEREERDGWEGIILFRLLQQRAVRMKKEFSYFCYHALILEASKFQCNTLYHLQASTSFATKRANNTQSWNLSLLSLPAAV